MEVGHSISGDCCQLEQSFEFKEQIIINHYYEITNLYKKISEIFEKKNELNEFSTIKTSLKHISKTLLSFSSKKIVLKIF